MEDQKIIELIRVQKHDKVFTALYKYFPVVKKMILANGGRSEDAEDIYQEALIVFYKKAASPDFKLTAAISTYVYSIAKFMWKDELKKQQKYSFAEITGLHVDEAEFAAGVQTEERFKLAEKAISQLSGRCKELLILFYFQSKRLEDIAAKMGYNSGNTAKNQKYKCLEAAKIKLKSLQQFS